MSFKANPKVQKIMVMPINLTFRMLQNRTRVQIWLYENTNLRIEGKLPETLYVESRMYLNLSILFNRMYRWF